MGNCFGSPCSGNIDVFWEEWEYVKKKQDPMGILDERFSKGEISKGEISKEEYEERKQSINLKK
ncbi:SHOCT domain-containing protein [Changchengzhania lutea]|uniref:SHOCT domain-containing protein n=1 Tax=Changchengzhania lutea TaxID=2049305 RepID=UPI001FE89392|nr:SHOCT domain-containing protein [Changchengzhania lutea]